MKYFPLLTLLLVGCGEPTETVMTENDGRLTTASQYPNYYSWNGTMPTLLIGGSNHEYPFLAEDWQKELEYLSKTGGNYVRFAIPVDLVTLTLNTKEFNELPPYFQQWSYLKAYLTRADQLGVAVEIDVWDHLAFNRLGWSENIWTARGSLGGRTLPQAFIAGEHPFYSTTTVDGDTVKLTTAYQKLLSLQQDFIDDLLLTVSSFDNVIYNVSVPSNAQIPWMVHWGRYIEQKLISQRRSPIVSIGVQPRSKINIALFNQRLLNGWNAVYHRPKPYGNGLNGAALTHLRGIRVVERLIKFWDLKPTPEILLNANTSTFAAGDGKGNYLIYLPGAGSVNLAPDWEEQLPVEVTVVGYLGTQRSELLKPPYGDSFRLYTEEAQGGWLVLRPVQ